VLRTMITIIFQNVFHSKIHRERVMLGVLKLLQGKFFKQQSGNMITFSEIMIIMECQDG